VLQNESLFLEKPGISSATLLVPRLITPIEAIRSNNRHHPLFLNSIATLSLLLHRVLEPYIYFDIRLPKKIPRYRDGLP